MKAIHSMHLSTRPSMRLSEYTDYTLRVLMYCAAHRDRLVTIGELADHHGVSKSHLMKVVNDLAHQGLIVTTRGHGGGLRLLKEPGAIRIGDVVRASETDFRLVECFNARTNLCSLTPNCRLKHVFDDALQAYFKVLDSATLADVSLGALASPRRKPAGPAGHGPVRGGRFPCRSAGPGPRRPPRRAEAHGPFARIPSSQPQIHLRGISPTPTRGPPCHGPTFT